MSTSVREQVLAAFLAQLESVDVAEVTVQRNRDTPVESYPSIVMVDGGQTPDVESGPGFKQVELRVAVELFVKANLPELLAEAFDELYGKVVVAALTDRTLGNLAVDITEGDMEDPIVVREEGVGPTMCASLGFSIDYWVAVSDPYTLAA